jgi:hypothetical protein
LERLLHESHSRGFVTGLGHVALDGLAFMIDGTPGCCQSKGGERALSKLTPSLASKFWANASKFGNEPKQVTGLAAAQS